MRHEAKLIHSLNIAAVCTSQQEEPFSKCLELQEQSQYRISLQWRQDDQHKLSTEPGILQNIPVWRLARLVHVIVNPITSYF